MTYDTSVPTDFFSWHAIRIDDALVPDPKTLLDIPLKKQTESWTWRLLILQISLASISEFTCNEASIQRHSWHVWCEPRDPWHAPRPVSEMVHSSPEHRTLVPAQAPAPGSMGADLAKLLSPEHRNRLELSRSVQELSSMFNIVTQAEQAIEDNTGSNRWV